VLSLLAPPQPGQEQEDGVDPVVAGQDENIDVRASKRYYTTVERFLRDFDRTNWANERMGNAGWFDRYARKIDNLPIKGVDPELLEFGADVSQKLRGMAASLRGVDVELNAQENSITWISQYDPSAFGGSIWGGFGYRAPGWQVQTNLPVVRERQAETVSQGARDREQLWKMLKDSRNRVRIRMTKKYGPRFEK
jgi:hypothetical protein